MLHARALPPGLSLETARSFTGDPMFRIVDATKRVRTAWLYGGMYNPLVAAKRVQEAAAPLPDQAWLTVSP